MCFKRKKIVLKYNKNQQVVVVGSCYTLVYKQHGMKNIQLEKNCVNAPK
jgi:hypothetical protein